jgi:hypothetical protein
VAYIYVIINDVNGKRYIGKTERELKIRIKEYFADRHKANRVNRPLY